MSGEVFGQQVAAAVSEAVSAAAADGGVSGPLVSPGVVAAAGSHLENLRARREAALRQLHLDRRVPGMGALTVRFKPLTVEDLDRVAKAFATDSTAAGSLRHDATLLATGCVAVWDKTEDQPDPPAGAPTFGNGLAERLGLTSASSAAEVVLNTYLAEGHVTQTVRRLMAWSGYSADEVDLEFAGN